MKNSRGCLLRTSSPRILADGNSNVTGQKTTAKNSSSYACVWETMSRAILTSFWEQMASSKVSHPRTSLVTFWIQRIFQDWKSGKMWRHCQMDTWNIAVSRHLAWLRATIAGSMRSTAVKMEAFLCASGLPVTLIAPKNLEWFVHITTIARFLRWVKVRKGSWKWQNSSFKTWREVCLHACSMLPYLLELLKPTSMRWSFSLRRKDRETAGKDQSLDTSKGRNISMIQCFLDLISESPNHKSHDVQVFRIGWN